MHTATHDDVWTIVPFAFSRPFEVNRDRYGYGQHTWFVASYIGKTNQTIWHGITLVTYTSLTKTQRWGKTQIQMRGETQVGNESHTKTRSYGHGARVIYIAIKVGHTHLCQTIIFLNMIRQHIYPQKESKMYQFVIYIWIVLCICLACCYQQ